MSRPGIRLVFGDQFPGEKTRTARLPYENAGHVVVDGACPKCTHAPLRAAGVRHTLVKGHDTYTSDGGCLECNFVLGKLVVTVSTIFGIEEDERVLGGRCRVY